MNPIPTVPSLINMRNNIESGGQKEETTKLNMKKEIRKAMNKLYYIPEVDGLYYEDMCIH